MTLYVADEGNSTITLLTDNNETETSLTTDPLAGLQKWVLVPGSSPYWQLVYVIRDGLQINQPQKIPGYGVPTFTTGLRNLTGKVNGDGTVTIYAITARTGAAAVNPTRPNGAITDEIAATQLPVDDGKGGGSWGGGKQTLDQFVSVQQSRSGEVFRGVLLRPPVITAVPSSDRSDLRGWDQASVPAALRAAISAGSSQAARAASAVSGLVGCGGIGRSGTVREKRGAGAGWTTPSIST